MQLPPLAPESVPNPGGCLKAGPLAASCTCGAEAETLQQRAERKRGRDALGAFDAAAAAYSRVSELGAALTEEEQQAAAFGLVSGP